MGHSPRIGIRSFGGEVYFNAEAEQANGFRLSMKANSLSVLDDISDKDRKEIEQNMNEQVLETAKYPEIVYEAADVSIKRLESALFTGTINGKLNFHGVTRNQSIPVRIAEGRRVDDAQVGDGTRKQCGARRDVGVSSAPSRISVCSRLRVVGR